MRIARIVHDDTPVFAIVQGDGPDATFAVVSGDPFFQPPKPTGQVVPAAEARLLSPIIPRSKVVGIGRNYAEHARELGNEVPENPLMFLKPNTSVIGPGDPIRFPSFSSEISYEAELAVVVGRICKDVPAAKWRDVVFGFTAANDLTARDVQKTDGQWARAKGFDGSCVLGPWIETELDPADLAVRARLDGETVQAGRTSEMIFSVPELIERVSAAFTLLPGDVILTGTPAGVGVLRRGQAIEVEVEGIGSFSNPVAG